MALALSVLNCAGLPEAGQTGQVAKVVVTDDAVVPRDISVHPGDEVAIINRRSRPIWIYFNRDRRRELSCQRGFAYAWGIEEAAKVEPGGSASLCFARPGEYGYRVQFHESERGGARLGELDFHGLAAGVVVAP